MSFRSCPFCREEIRTDAIRCRHCGSLLSPELWAADPDASTTVQLALAQKYEVIEPVGRGGMAVVYKARQRNLDRLVALKALLHHPALDDESLARFHREARAIARLSHPNIITVYDEGFENGVHFMAMEYLSGTDLYTLIQKRGALPQEDVVRIMIPIANALGHAHENGVIHRDVKSGNIFLTASGRPVLMDFGIAMATTATQVTVSGAILGTPEFMSPEQAAGRPLDLRTDLYSLGVVIYHALTGRYPFSSDSPLSTIYKICNEEYLPLGTYGRFPEFLEGIVSTCLCKDPADRFQSAFEIEESLSTGRATRPRRASGRGSYTSLPPLPESTGDLAMGSRVGHEKTPERSSARRIVLLVVLLILVPVLAGIALYWVNSSMSRPPVPTPSVVGQPVGVAERALQRQGLNVRRKIVDTTAPAWDQVVAQAPRSGTPLQKRDTVQLLIARHVSMPDLQSLEAPAALLRLARLDIVPGIEYVPTTPVRSGRVLFQLPAPGSRLSRTSSVVLTIGR